VTFVCIPCYISEDCGRCREHNNTQQNFNKQCKESLHTHGIAHKTIPGAQNIDVGVRTQLVVAGGDVVFVSFMNPLVFP